MARRRKPRGALAAPSTPGRPRVADKLRPARRAASAAQASPPGGARATPWRARTLAAEAWSLTVRTSSRTAPIVVVSGLLCGALLVGTDLSRQMVAVVWLLPTYVVLGAVLALAIDTLDGGAGRIGPALRAGIGSVLGLVVAGLFSQLAILIFLLLLVIPGVLRYLSYLLVYPLVVSGESGGFDALRLSAERMRGRRAAAGGAVLLTGWPMLLAMGIDWVVYGDPLVSLLGTEGAPAPAWLEVLLTAMAGFFPLPLTMLTAVLYHRTAPAGA